jgi:crotonobetaine/carnitine-CoA ligase
VLDVLLRALDSEPDLTALLFEDGAAISVRDLVGQVEAFGGFLSQRLDRGDRVAILAGNRIEFFVAWFAAAASGLVLVPINPSVRNVDAQHILADSGARLAIVAREQLPLVDAVRSQCPALGDVLVLSDHEPNGLAEYAGAGFDLRQAAADVSSGDVLNVFYTSGTTGPPKGCMVDHEYWLRFVEMFLFRYRLDRTDRMLCCLQFFYNDPPWQLLLSMSAGTTLVAMRRFSVSRFWNVVRQNRVTVLFSIAGIAGLLLKAKETGPDDGQSVRLAVHVGIPPTIHSALVERWGFPWLEAYGLTESGLVVSMPVEHAEEMTGSGSIGLPLPDVDVRMVDEDGSEIATEGPGELWLRGPAMMHGYLNNPTATAEMMEGGWLHTGDLVTRDERGFLFFRGRVKDIVRRGGENISCAEVEHVLRSHPRVADVAALPVFDEVRGEECLVWVVPVAGETVRSVPPQELADFCAGRLAPYKVPRYYAYREDDFPRTASMRVKKAELSTQLSGDVWDRAAQAQGA